MARKRLKPEDERKPDFSKSVESHEHAVKVLEAMKEMERSRHIVRRETIPNGERIIYEKRRVSNIPSNKRTRHALPVQQAAE